MIIKSDFFSGTFHSDTDGTFQSDTSGTFHSAISGTFVSDTGGTFIPILSAYRFFSPKGDVFATMKAVFWNKTGLGFWTVQELALRHKARRTGRRTEGHSHHGGVFLVFVFSK